MTAAPTSPIPDRIVTALSERRAAVLDLIRQAQREITLSFFRCNDREIFLELTRAVARGVAVNVMVTSRAKGQKKLKKMCTALEQTGASVHAYNDAVVKYHAKYLVADEGPAIVASLNLTRKCFNKTWDALVVTHDPAVVSGLRELMAADRDRRPLPDPLSARLIVGPERARRQFTALIEQARTSIQLFDAKQSDPDLMALLNKRREDGLTVNTFAAKRVGDLKSHGKIMLIDDVVAVVGSLALAALSLDFRREVAIIVDEPSAVDEIRHLFRTLNCSSMEVAADAGGSA